MTLFKNLLHVLQMKTQSSKFLKLYFNRHRIRVTTRNWTRLSNSRGLILSSHYGPEPPYPYLLINLGISWLHIHHPGCDGVLGSPEQKFTAAEERTSFL